MPRTIEYSRDGELMARGSEVAHTTISLTRDKFKHDNQLTDKINFLFCYNNQSVT